MKKHSQESIVSKIKEANPTIEVRGEYKSFDDKIEAVCKKCGKTFYPVVSALLHGHGCPECAHNRKLTTSEFVKKFSDISPDVLVLGEYVNAKTPILCECRRCGKRFEGNPYAMLHNGTRCKSCSLSDHWKRDRSDKIVDVEEFNRRLSSYDNSIELVGEYKGYSKRNDFVCKDCGYLWSTTPSLIVSQRQHCPRCVLRTVAAKNTRDGNEVFQELKELNKKVTVLSKEYVRSQDKVLVSCNECGHIWKATPAHIRNGRGCPECAKRSRAEGERLSPEEVSKRFYKVHPDWEILSDYIRAADPMLVRCKHCGAEWHGKLFDLLKRVNCPVCDMGKKSRGEEAIARFLRQVGEPFETQKAFDGCRNVFPLRFDFYLPEMNMCIEYDGEQHFRPVDAFGGENSFAGTYARDNIKNEYCTAHNIRLVRIPYYRFDEIEDILSEILPAEEASSSKGGA